MEVRRIKKVGELIPYNIVPLEEPSFTNVIGAFPEVRGAISSIRYTEHFPILPADFEISGERDADMFDLLEYVFGFQMAKELDAILDHGEAKHAGSCAIEAGSVSFLDQIIRPIYEAMGKIYLMDIHIWYTVLSAIVGGVMGARARLGEVRNGILEWSFEETFFLPVDRRLRYFIVSLIAVNSSILC
ncbi:hypothetical protein K2173_005060 [Erythroxylum novogranatense]|uniref:Uncharacterized protein n=1 Tax=Erythroxylum novogranatense TaxID=1862640 RepID=A0AAV8TDE9_9ROSI|nr:hypothetical protein K2173_005060 [Erythroxylum novogranatense]